MKIYKMTATFGKLERETLVLQPGLNIIEAPNEWGKSTWCAFLVAMLYGIDTRAKSTKTALADKEKYTPWSGSPMAGTVELNWNGRDITLLRETRGRVPMGCFQAFETDTGLPVPELTGDNCGQLLLGVEQSVFRRSAFIRQADLPVTQDEALRRRLNDLVTTGDETGEADRLEKELRDIKNRCRYNKSGLLPQTEARREELKATIAERNGLDARSRELKRRLEALEQELGELKNHRIALDYAQAEADACRVARARELRDKAEAEMLLAEKACEGLSGQEEADKRTKALREFCDAWNEIHVEETLAPREPVLPEKPELLRGRTEKQAEAMVAEDRRSYDQLTRKRSMAPIWIGAALLIPAAAALVALRFYWGLIPWGLLVLLLVILRSGEQRARKRSAAELAKKYDDLPPETWLEPVIRYRTAMTAYEKELAEYRAVRADLDIRKTFLKKQHQTLCGGEKPEKMLKHWLQIQRKWELLGIACREFHQADVYWQNLRSMIRPVEPPAFPDLLTCSRQEAVERMALLEGERQQLQNRLGQYQGRMEALGQQQMLEKELAAVECRIEKLEQTYAAATLALETLAKARQELQRRFAPRISGRARELLSIMTGERYDRLTLDSGLSLLAGAGEETGLREVLWRSDGTVDQLYLALRLAVAEALLPEVPLVLDDALVRFDDVRLRAALDILKQQAEDKQVILFTCQSREKRMLG